MQLISVSGIGGNTARTILSAFTVAELCEVISGGNETLLKSVKGIGLKTAQRIIVDLKDKISGLSAGASSTQVASTANNDTIDSAVAALVMLGFPGAAANKVVQNVVKSNPSATVEQTIKLALKQL